MNRTIWHRATSAIIEEQTNGRRAEGQAQRLHCRRQIENLSNAPTAGNVYIPEYNFFVMLDTRSIHHRDAESTENLLCPKSTLIAPGVANSVYMAFPHPRPADRIRAFGKASGKTPQWWWLAGGGCRTMCHALPVSAVVWHSHQCARGDDHCLYSLAVAVQALRLARDDQRQCRCRCASISQPCQD